MKFIVYIIISIYLVCSAIYANDTIEITSETSVLPITWTDLLPADAFDFVPESGVTDEMWSDPDFLTAVEEAGLATVTELNGVNIRLTGFMVPLDVDFGEAETVTEFVLVPSAEGTKTNSVTVSASPKSTSNGTIKPVNLIFTPFNSVTVAKPASSTAVKKSGSLHISSVTPLSGTKSKASAGNKSVQVIGRTDVSEVISIVSLAYMAEHTK